MQFRDISLSDKALVKHYMYRYGENSCQHSFQNLFCLKEKYKNKIGEQDGILFIRQESKDEEGIRSYLMPAGEDRERGLDLLLEDAHLHGCKAKIHTVTEKSAGMIASRYPEVFSVREHRDYAEYLYTSEKLAYLPGAGLASKRYDIRTFYRDYGDAFHIEPITREAVPAILDFQAKWLAEKTDDQNREQLDYENDAIQLGLTYFEELELSGILTFVGNQLVGYAYGSAMSDSAYDVYIEKGAKEFKDIFRILNRELVRQYGMGFVYINREEDLGVEGLRKAKMSYRPDVLMKKFSVYEK